jgi:hypothetical protein
VAQLVVDHLGLQQLYDGWLAVLPPTAWEEAKAMARARKGLEIDFRPAIKMYGLGTILEQAGIERVIEQVGIDRVMEQVGIDRVTEQVGIDRVIEHLGEKEVIKRIGLERILANLSPSERRELKRRLQ